MSQKKTERISLRVPAQLKTDAVRKAKQEKKTLNEYVEQAIKEKNAKGTPITLKQDPRDMIVLHRPRRSGKTTDLIKIANESNAIMVTDSGSVPALKEMGAQRIISYGQFLRSDFAPDDKFAIDEVEGLLRHIAGYGEIVAITATDHGKH